jgi:peptide/nickel transport system substrate-binding protein
VSDSRSGYPGTLPAVDPHSGATRRQFVQRAVGGVLAAGWLGGALSACSSDAPASDAQGSGGPPATPTGTVTVALPDAPNSLDAARRAGVGAFWATINLYDTLMAWSPDYSSVVPQLLTSWSSSPDLTEWTGRIRPGVEFHDGTPLDATAIRANFEYFLQNADFLFVPLPIKSMDDSDPKIIKFVFDAPYVDFTRNLTLLGMQSPKAIAAGPSAIDEHPVGSGPFQFVSQTESSIELKAFPRYWNTGKPYIARLTYQIIEDPGARVSALQSGQINVVPKIDPSQASVLAHGGTTKVASAASWLVTYLSFKLVVPSVSDIRVRQAIAYAIDREGMLKALGYGYGTVANSFEVPGIIGYQPVSPGYAYDPGKAMALVKEIGTKISLNIAIVAGDANAGFLAGENAAQAIVGMLGQVGINATVSSLQDATFNSNQLSPSSTVAGAWLVDQPWFTGGPVLYGVSVPVYDLQQADPSAWAQYSSLNAQMNQTPDGPQRDAIIGQIQSLYAGLCVSIPLFDMPQLDGLSKNVEGYTPDKRNFGPRFDDVYLG